MKCIKSLISNEIPNSSGKSGGADLRKTGIRKASIADIQPDVDKKARTFAGPGLMCRRTAFLPDQEDQKAQENQDKRGSLGVMSIVRRACGSAGVPLMVKMLTSCARLSACVCIDAAAAAASSTSAAFCWVT